MKYFGYIESGIAALKIIVMAAFIVIGLIFIGSHGVLVRPAPFSRLQSFFPNNISGFLQSMLIVVFTYSGISTIVMATSDTKDSSKSIPKATMLVTKCAFHCQRQRKLHQFLMKKRKEIFIKMPGF